MKFVAILQLTISLHLVYSREMSETELINENLKTIIELMKNKGNQSNKNDSSFNQPSSCAEIYLRGHAESGIYTIYPRPWFNKGTWFKSSIQVYCDMETEGGGWTVFQRRDDFEPRENFYRNWADYRNGFGQLQKEFWLGNDNLYVLTNQDYVTLRVDLEDFDGNYRYAIYKNFRVSDWHDKFTAEIGDYEGNAGNGLIYQATSANFSTYDEGSGGCAKIFKGAWWYTGCHAANLNGLYLKGNHSSYADGVNWAYFKGQHYSLKKSEMKVRPAVF